MGISFGMLVFRPVPGGVAVGVQMALVGVNIMGNGALALFGRLPCVVVTADNGVVAPLAASLVARLAERLADPGELLATSVAGVAVACASFGLAQLLLVRLHLVRLVQYLPYSIPMGFLSGIGLELCSGVSLAGEPMAQGFAVVFAATLCLGSWRYGWPLSTLFPVLLVLAVLAFYIAGGPSSWLLEVEGATAVGSFAGLWEPYFLRRVHWELLAELGKWDLSVLCLLGCLQNCLFAGLFARAPGLRVAADANAVLREFGGAFALGGLSGFAGGFHNMACFSLSRELRSYRRFPASITATLSVLLWFTGLGPVLKVPRFVFAALLLWVGLKFLRTYLVQPARMLPRTETAVIVCVATVMKVGGFSTGVLAGLLLALVNMVSELAALSCVQHVSHGHETRSNAVRSVRAEQLLLKHGHEVLVLRLAPGFVFFATSAELLEIVEERLQVVAPPWQAQDPLGVIWDESESENEEVQPAVAGVLSAVVIDFTLCRGFDGSLVGVLQQLAALGSQHGFKLRLAGLQKPQLSWLKSHTAHGVCSFFPDLDRTLESVENELLARLGMTVIKEQRRRCFSSSGLPRRLSADNLSALASPATGWALLLLYSDVSAASRSARPAVAQAMALLEGRCDLFEAGEDQCPRAAAQFGPAPALVLLRCGEPLWRLENAKLLEKPRTAVGTAALPSASNIAREVEQQIRAAEAEPPTAAQPVNSRHAAEAAASSAEAAVLRRPSKRSNLTRSRTTITGPTWAQFLDLAGVPANGPLAALAAYVKGPRIVPQGEVLLHKGEAQNAVLFLVSGLVSLWNEGRGHDQDQVQAIMPSTWLGKKRANSGNLQMPAAKENLSMLSGGTSRLLRIGPGWVLGGDASAGSGLRPPLAPLTCLSETELEVFELVKEDARQLQADDPVLKLALHELLMHFSAVLVQHMAVQLSDWHTLVYSG